MMLDNKPTQLKDHHLRLFFLIILLLAAIVLFFSSKFNNRGLPEEGISPPKDSNEAQLIYLKKMENIDVSSETLKAQTDYLNKQSLKSKNN